jgi:hypothetical protein
MSKDIFTDIIALEQEIYEKGAEIRVLKSQVKTFKRLSITLFGICLFVGALQIAVFLSK